MTILAETIQELDDLRDQRKIIENNLAESVRLFDADGMVRYRSAIQTNEIRRVAHEANFLGLKRDEEERERLAAIAERDRLDSEYKAANEKWAAAITVANEARIVAQTLGALLFIQEQTIDTHRQDRNAADQKQKVMVAAFIEENRIKQPIELACDLD